MHGADPAQRDTGEQAVTRSPAFVSLPAIPVSPVIAGAIICSRGIVRSRRIVCSRLVICRRHLINPGLHGYRRSGGLDNNRRRHRGAHNGFGNNDRKGQCSNYGPQGVEPDSPTMGMPVPSTRESLCCDSCRQKSYYNKRCHYLFHDILPCSCWVCQGSAADGFASKAEFPFAADVQFFE